MGVFILRKAGAALIVVFLASVSSSPAFARCRATPLSPSPRKRDPKVLGAIREKYGLDDPLPVPDVNWDGPRPSRAISAHDSRGIPVSDTIVNKLPMTLELAFPRAADRSPDRDPRRG